jgi:hypothetical protein
MRTVFVAAVFFILAYVVLVAYQNPVNYIDSLDVTQANMGNQKFSEWITANEADIDTNALELDTLFAHRDTLHSRVDSLANRDSVFDAYDAGGNQAVGLVQEELIELDTETREDAIYVHGADAYGVEITTAGWYRVNYGVTMNNVNGTVAPIVYAYIKTYTPSAWTESAGTRSWGELTASTSSMVLLHATKRIQFAAGDSVALAVYNTNAWDDVQTVANTARLGIEKLH